MMSHLKARWDFTHHLRRLETITDFSTWPRSDPAWKRNGTRASLYKKYRRGANVIDGLDTGLSVASVAMAATGVGLLTTIIAAPVAIGLQAEAIAWVARSRREVHLSEARSQSQET